MRKQSTPDAPLTISIVGPGNLGTALALTLAASGYPVTSIVVRVKDTEAKALARKLKARLIELGREPIEGTLVWIAVPDDAIARTAKRLARTGTGEWKGKLVFHSSGALTSDELAPLRQRGAKVASVHPMMTFVRGSAPEMAGVAFAVEGDAAAARVAKAIVERLGGSALSIRKQNKVLYHAFGSFASPLVVALMASMEQVAKAAGIGPADAKTMMVPLLWQTLRNYLKHDAASAFSGPLVRGDVATVRKHLAALRKVPEAREVYVALAKAALGSLPVKNRKVLERQLTTNH